MGLDGSDRTEGAEETNGCLGRYTPRLPANSGSAISDIVLRKPLRLPSLEVQDDHVLDGASWP